METLPEPSGDAPPADPPADAAPAVVTERQLPEPTSDAPSEAQPLQEPVLAGGGQAEPAGEPPAGEEGAAQRLRLLYDKVNQLDVSSLAQEWGVSEILLQDILNSLARPGSRSARRSASSRVPPWDREARKISKRV